MDTRGDLGKNRNKERSQAANELHPINAHDQLRRKYSKLDHEVKKMTKLDKRKFVEGLVVEAEEAAGRQDLMTLYRY